MTVQWTIDQGIGHLTLNDPPPNTMTLEFFGEMKSIIYEISLMDDLKAVIISGKGRHYSSGADISELLTNVDEQIMYENYRAFAMIEQLQIPVISAIRGVCLGSAFELALFSHFRICSEDAVFGLPESNFNLMPGIGGIQRVAALAGKAKAIESILRGLTFSAAEALELNLVDAVVPKRALTRIALSFATRVPGPFFKEDRSACIHKYLTPLCTIEQQ